MDSYVIYNNVFNYQRKRCLFEHSRKMEQLLTEDHPADQELIGSYNEIQRKFQKEFNTATK